VKSNTVNIVGRAIGGGGKLAGFSASGGWMKGHELTVYGVKGGVEVLWDKKPVNWKGAKTSSKTSKTSKASCGASNDFSGPDYPQVPTGWKVVQGFSSNVQDKKNCGNGWNGYKNGGGMGALGTTLQGSGTATLRYGDCWGAGTTVLYKNGKKIDQAPKTIKSFTFDFVTGDKIKLRDEGANAVLWLGSLTFQCKPALLEASSTGTEQFVVAGLVDLKKHEGNSFTPTHKELAELPKDSWWTEIEGRWKGVGFGMQGSGTKIYEFALPNNVFIDFVPVDGLTMIIKMQKQPGQAGYCGNFNGKAEDDAQNGKNVGQGLSTLPKGPFPSLVEVGDNGTECAPELLKKAKEGCNHIPEEVVRQACIYDVCATSDTNFITDSAFAEILEIQAGRGVPVYDGKGRCLDYQGQRYNAFQTKDRVTDEQCIEALRAMYEAKGDDVRGAQRGQGSDSPCQILADPGVDLSDADIAGGWDLESDDDTSVKEGSGLVSGHSDSEESGSGWSCWKLN